MNKLYMDDITAAKKVVILAAAPSMHRQYFDTPYVEGVKKQPVCFSSNLKTPDKQVKEPQAKFCVMCPNNIQGSGNGNSRACKFHQKIAVSEYAFLNGPVYQMNIASHSLFNKSGVFEDMGFLQYVKRLFQQGQSISNVVTRIRVIEMWEGQEYKRISFKPMLHLNRKEIDYVRQRSKSEDIDQYLTFSYALDLLDSNHFFEVSKKMGLGTEV